MNKSSRRALLRTSVLWPTTLAWGQQAETYPDRPIRLVMPYAAGGGPDVLMRQYLPHLSQLVGQKVFVDNKVGAGGSIAAEYVAQLPADGYNMLMGASTHIIQKLMQPSLRFDPSSSFSHVSRFAYTSSVLVVSSNSNIITLDDLVATARQRPGEMIFGSGGQGSSAHVLSASLATLLKFEAIHVPYRGSVDILRALVSNDVQFATPITSTALPQIQTGLIRPLAVSSDNRDPTLPSVPTLQELTGIKDLIQISWSGLWAPLRTPESILDRWFNAIKMATNNETDLKKSQQRQGVEIESSISRQEFSNFIANETEKYDRLLKKIKLER